MRTFNLEIQNGVAQLPQTMSADLVRERLNARKGGFMHVVAYTDAKALKKARNENMNLVKITDVMCINGLPKREQTENDTDNETENRRPKTFDRINYAMIQYIKSGEFAINPHLSNNPKHRAKSYYVDSNSGRVYDKQWLVENGYISSSTYTNDNDVKFVSFKLDKIIIIK